MREVHGGLVGLVRILGFHVMTCVEEDHTSHMAWPKKKKETNSDRSI